MPELKDIRAQLKKDGLDKDSFNNYVRKILIALAHYFYHKKNDLTEKTIKESFRAKHVIEFLTFSLNNFRGSEFDNLLKDCRIVEDSTYSDLIENKKVIYAPTSDLLSIFYGYAGVYGIEQDISLKTAFSIPSKDIKDGNFKLNQIRLDLAYVELTNKEIPDEYVGDYIAYGYDEFYSEDSPRYFVSIFQIWGNYHSQINFEHGRNDDEEVVYKPDRSVKFTKKRKFLSLYAGEEGKSKSGDFLLTAVLAQFCFAQKKPEILAVPYISNTDHHPDYNQYSGTTFLQKLPVDEQIKKDLSSDTFKKKLIGRNLDESKFISKNEILSCFDFENAVKMMTDNLHRYPAPILYGKK